MDGTTGGVEQSDQEMFTNAILWLNKFIEYRDALDKKDKSKLEAWQSTYNRTITRLKNWMEHENIPVETMTKIFTDNKINKDLEIVFLKLWSDLRQKLYFTNKNL